MNCLNQAIEEERIHQVRLLLALGVDPELRDKKDFYRTPLLKASILQCEDSAHKIAKILLRNGVNVNAIDDKCRSSLHYACESGKSNLIDTLLKEGSVELNKQDHEGRTPLMLSAMNGHLRASRILALKLAKFDLDMDLRDHKGFTALLLAIKNRNYDIAHDLLRYGNASTTIRDDVLFKNAGDWLKKTLLDSYPHFAQAKRLEGAKSADVQEQKEKELEPEPSSTNLPLVTVGGSHDGISESQYTEGASEVTAIKEAAALSGLLFEPDPYGRHSRPPSSVMSKMSASSTVQRRIPSPIQSEAMLQISEVVPARLDSATSGSNVRTQRSLRRSANHNADEVGRQSQRGSAVRSSQGKSRETSSKPKIDSAANNMRREAIANAAVNLPISLDTQYRPPSKNSFLLLVKVPAKDQSQNSLTSIQKLKQAIHEQRKRKVTRPSTRLTRPYTAIPYETAPEKEDLKLPIRPHTRAQAGQGRKSSIVPPKKSIPIEMQPEQPTIAKARSLISLSTIVSEDVGAYGSNPYKQASSIEKAQRNLRTLFALYTDSYLWSPVKRKSASLSVQLAPEPSEKLTLTSEFTTSVSDLASIVERGSVAPSEATSLRQDGKFTGRGRLASASALSRTSRKSAGAKSTASSNYR